MALETFKNVTAKDVNDFHRKSDLNRNYTAQHHSLGSGQYEATPGRHRHLGNDGSLELLDGDIITGSLSTQTNLVLGQVCALLEKLGASDGTTP